MTHVATVTTTLTPAQAMGAIRDALPSGASQTAIALIAAQSATETNHWQAMHNWNFGNVTPTQAQLAAGADWMDQGLPMQYLSFPNADAGAAAMVGWLSSHGLLAAAEAGDLSSYMAGLERDCYLGCVGLTDPTGHTVAQSDYDSYQADIASIMAALQGVTPVSPPGGRSSRTILGAIAAVGVASLLAFQPALRAQVGTLLRSAWRLVT